jgi:hypothetical protein
MKLCLRCDNARWVCEAHPDRPWSEGPRACACGAPGSPCPLCNRTEPNELPAMPDGFVVEETREVDLTAPDEAEADEIRDALARLQERAKWNN